jgi:hypothetical protein
MSQHLNLTTPIITGGISQTLGTNMVRMFHHRNIGGYKYKLEAKSKAVQTHTIGIGNQNITAIDVTLEINTFKRGTFGPWNSKKLDIKVTGDVNVSKVEMNGANTVSSITNISNNFAGESTYLVRLFCNSTPQTSIAPTLLYNNNFWSIANLNIVIKLITIDGDFMVNLD